MIFKTLNGDLTVFNKTLISTKDHLKSLQAVNATVYNKNGAFNLQGLLVNSSQSVSTFTKLNNAFKAYNGNLSKSTQLQNAYAQAVGKQNVTLGNYLAGLNGAKASMGGYVKSLVAAKAASIGLQAASIALNTAISMGITLAISALISAITKWVNKEKEAREEAIENAKAAKEEANNLSELLNKYNQLSKEVKSNQGVKEDLLSVQSDLLEALGIEASQIDTLIEKYGDLNSAINQITLDSLRDAQGDLMVAIDAYEKDLIKVGKGYAHWYSLFDRNLLSTGQSSTDALDILEKAGIISSGSHGEGGGALVLTGNDKTVEGILENYQKLKDAQEALNTAIDNGEITMEEMIKIPLYNDINSRLEELEESIGNYNTAIADLNKNMAQQQILKSLAEQSSIPETKEEFEDFQQSMIDTAIASTKFKGSQDDIRDSIINVLSVMPEFKKYFEELNDIQSSTSNIENPISFSITDTITQLNTQLKPAFDSLKSAYQDIFTTDDNGKPLFTLENVDLSMLDSIKSAIDDLNENEELGISVDYSSFEMLADVLTNSESTAEDVRNAINGLAGTIVQSLNPSLQSTTAETYQLTKSMLESLGVTNAEEVMISALGYSLTELSALRKAASDAGFDLANATDSEISMFIWEQTEAGNCAQELYALQLKKVLLNTTTINTSKDIEYILGLANSAGIASNALVKLAEAKQMLDTANANGDARGIYEAKKYANQLRDEIQNDVINFKVPEINFDGTDKSKSSKSGSKSKSEKDLWLEEYKKKLEELKRQLNEGLITQKDFYYQSEALMNEYLKDSPTHLAKYAEEISDAENTLHDEWIKTLEYEKSELEKNVSDNVLVQWQYYQRLSELAEEYYNTAGASYGKFADEYDEITREIQEGQKKLWEDVFSELNTQIDDLQSACSTVKDAVKEYSENQSLSIDTVQKLIDLEPQYLAMLLDENGQLQLNEEAYAKLAKAKLEEMKVDLAYQALNTINGLENEAQAVELLTGKYAELRDTSLGAVEAMLQVAVAEAHERGEKQGQAADMMMQVYQSQKKVIDMADFSIPSLTGEDKDKEEKKFLKTFDWIGTLLEKISEKTSKLIDKVDKFYNWQKKNAMINRAVKSTDREINQNERAYQAYMKKANSVGLGLNYVRKIQNGALSIEDITNEKLADKIDDYQEWCDKAQSCLDTIEDLYDKQRDLIKQKLDNVLDYYSDMSSYLSSITSKIESVISLNDEMGKRSSLTELVEQFASISDQLETVTTKDIAGITITEGSLGDSKKVADAVNRDKQELADSIKSEIDNLDVKESGTYTKLLNNIAKVRAQIDEYQNKGWDKSKAKSYEKLQQKLRNYYDLQKALDENATSDTIANYEKTYTAYQKLQNKIDSGKALSKSEQKRYDTYTKQLEDLRIQGQSALDKLYGELSEADGTAPKQSESDRIKDEIAEIQSDLENTATYQNLLKSIETIKDKIAALDEKGYENLTSGQKKTYDKLRVQLEDYYDQKQALDENATASNIAEYNKIYLAWKKLQDKLDGGKNLSENQWKQYNDYTKQLEDFADEKANTVSKLNDALEEALNPSDKLGQIEKTYEESAEETYNSYQNQIDSIKGEAENTKQYQNILAKAQKLEQKKDTKGLSKSEQAQLDKYNKELEALQAGATGANISDYIKTWESWYKLQQKLDNGKKLSDGEAKKYDTYKSQLEAWNEEKQTQINDLLSQMEDDLEQLQKTYTENVSGAESEVNDYYANLYSLAKQIAEYNITSLQTQLDYLDAYISYYKELVSLYDSFSGNKLTKILTDLDEDALAEKTDVYEKYLNTLQDKYNTTLSEMNEYSQLLDALDTNDFESSMDLFDKALESYKASGDTAMADKLQSVLDLLNERAVDADNWGEFADQWAEEWEKEFAAAKQELIGTAEEIQNVNDALRQIKLDNISDAINELDTAKGLLSSIADLIQDEWLYDGGELSEYGRAKVALLVSQLEDSQKKASTYLDLISEIQNNKDTYASDKAYMEDLNNATQNYYNTLGETASLENSIVELMKKSAEEEVNSIKKIIDARKQALQKKKEYYDYDKSLKNSQKEIDSIKAQIAALEGLSGAMDAATKAKLAQLKADLAEKEDVLQETKDEHTYNLQIDALDEFTKTLEEALDNSTKSVEEILKEQKDIISSAKDLYQTSTDSVNDTMDKIIAFYAGMGTSIDGLDLTPDGTGVASGNVLTVNTSVTGDSKVADAVNMTTEAINRAADAVNNTTDAVNAVQNTTENLSGYLQGKLNGVVDVSDSQKTDVLNNINDNTSKTLEILEKYGLEPVSPDKLWANFNPDLFNIAARQYETMINTKPYVPEYVTNRNEQQVVINNHYDSLITVEGSVDKNVVNDFKKISDDLYKNFTDRLYNEAKMVTGRRSVRRSVL